tara:strand:- start:85 stop:711 length:627 start_codon:yes stop_codon:yes gene_type:complete
MATIINADTSDGLKLTSDTSGLIEFQSGGVTKAGVNATGLTGDGSQLTGLPAGGKILQVLQTVKTDTFSTSSTSWVDWTGMSVTITPSSATNKILVTLTGGVSNDTNNSFQYIKLVRGATDIALGDAVASVTRCWIDGAFGTLSSFGMAQKSVTGSFLDSPATTSATTYKLQVIRTVNGTAYFGRSADTLDANRSSIPSVLTVMEVAG